MASRSTARWLVIADLLDQLHGRKHLVVGNNDNPVTRSSPGWSSVQTYAEVRIDDSLLVLCHYPFRTWRDMTKRAINLHGHSHGRLKQMVRQIDVGADVGSSVPIRLKRRSRKSVGENVPNERPVRELKR